jgi:hypothetical protein
VNAHGGRIWARENAGSGATFVFRPASGHSCPLAWRSAPVRVWHGRPASWRRSALAAFALARPACHPAPARPPTTTSRARRPLVSRRARPPTRGAAPHDTGPPAWGGRGSSASTSPTAKQIPEAIEAPCARGAARGRRRMIAPPGEMDGRARHCRRRGARVSATSTNPASRHPTTGRDFGNATLSPLAHRGQPQGPPARPAAAAHTRR